eukprot:354256-Chlamydomonas_euryale.AAC.1
MAGLPTEHTNMFGRWRCGQAWQDRLALSIQVLCAIVPTEWQAVARRQLPAGRQRQPLLPSHVTAATAADAARDLAMMVRWWRLQPTDVPRAAAARGVTAAATMADTAAEAPAA